MKIKTIIVSGIAILGLSVSAAEVGKSTPKGFTDDFEAAKAEATKSGKKIVAVFSGSDWCHWCKVLEKDYLSKPEFVAAATNDFVLVFIDNPNDQSLLSETGKKNNRALTDKYGIRGFPTVKILDADGKALVDSRPRDKVTPKDYAAQLRQDVEKAPLIEKHIKPYTDEFQKLMQDMAKWEEESLSSEKAGPVDEKAIFAAEQKKALEVIAQFKEIRKRAAAEKAPDAIAAEKQSLLQNLNIIISELDKVAKLTWDDVQKLKDAQKTK